MVRVPGSPHGIANRPSRLIAKVDNIMAWSERYKNKRSVDSSNGSPLTLTTPGTRNKAHLNQLMRFAGNDLHTVLINHLKRYLHC